MDHFWGIARKQKKNGKIKELLRGIPLFEQLTDRELAGIERILHERVYAPKEVIFRQGEPGIAMYIIESGSVLIEVGSDGKVLAELREGEFFGELALLDESPRSASAIAKTESKIFAFSQPDLFSMMERNPRLGIKIIVSLARIIGDRLKGMNEQLHELTKEKT